MSSILAELLKELNAGRLRVVDLTQPLSPQTPLLPLPPQFNNTPAFKIWESSRYDERGPAWYWNAFETGEHTGTHFDAPVHWISGKDLPRQHCGPNSTEEICRSRLRDRYECGGGGKPELFVEPGAYPTVGRTEQPYPRRARGYFCAQTGRSGRIPRTTST